MTNSINPIGITNIGDPFVFLDNGKYYLYATSFIDGFYCWVSDDLQEWSQPMVCYAKNNRSFGSANFWAPEVVKCGDKYFMHYSARWEKNQSLRIGVAVADKPVGPFIDVFDRQPMFDFGYAVIDGHVFKDDDGKNYFYYSRDCSEHVVEGYHESYVYGVELADDLITLIGEPKMVIRPEKDYEKIVPQFEDAMKYRWNEGPFVIKKEKQYYLMYSANFYADKNYCTCCAVSDNPLNGFVKYEKPILKYVENQVSGPGHNSVFAGKNGKLYAAYHVHTDYHHPSHDRQMFIDELYFDGNELKIKGPTF